MSQKGRIHVSFSSQQQWSLRIQFTGQYPADAKGVPAARSGLVVREPVGCTIRFCHSAEYCSAERQQFLTERQPNPAGIQRAWTGPPVRKSLRRAAGIYKNPAELSEPGVAVTAGTQSRRRASSSPRWRRIQRGEPAHGSAWHRPSIWQPLCRAASLHRAAKRLPASQFK